MPVVNELYVCRQQLFIDISDIVDNYKNIIIKWENKNMALIRKDNNHLLAMQILISNTCSLGGHSAVQLSLAPTQKVCNEIAACYVKWSINCEQSANILRETELTCSWAVVVPQAKKFVAFANRSKGAVLTGQEYSFFCYCTFFFAIFSVWESGCPQSWHCH